MRSNVTALRRGIALVLSTAGLTSAALFALPAPSASAVPAGSETAAVFPSSPKAIARVLVPASQYRSFCKIVSHESGWHVHAVNPVSGAYGLVQALPGRKMASVGADWRDDPVTQIMWGLKYMNSRYGGPNAAWAFWKVHHWY